MAYRWLGVLALTAACSIGCENNADGGPRGEGGSGGSAGPLCITSALCRACPGDGLCSTNDDCSIGSVCIESGCDSLEGLPIEQCVFAGGGACQSNADCPSGRECEEVPGENKRCVQTTETCESRFDCVLGFSCESGSCVDRRLPCSIDAHCPMNHVCDGTTSTSFCRRIQSECLNEYDCDGLAFYCADIDGDGKTECAGTSGSTQPSSDVCVNADCADADPSTPVCEASGVGSVTHCGEYGLCRNAADCAAGFSCVGLWPDGRRECVPSGGSCESISDCPVRQVCASPRDGGAPSCQAGLEL